MTTTLEQRRERIRFKDAEKKATGELGRPLTADERQALIEAARSGAPASDTAQTITAPHPELVPPHTRPPGESGKEYDRRVAADNKAEKARKEIEKAAATREKREYFRKIEAGRSARNLPMIRLGNKMASIRAIEDAINAGTISNLYVRGGNIVTVDVPSGQVVDDNEPPEVIHIVDRAKMNHILARKTITVISRKEKMPNGEIDIVEEEDLPDRDVISSVLSVDEWPGLNPLRSISTMPVFRADGTLVQEPGYDQMAQIIYSPTMSIKPVSEFPTVGELDEARDFLTQKLLADFPWTSGSLANFIGLLMTPMLRSFLGDPHVPAGILDASAPGSGKTLAALILTSLFRGYVRPWENDNGELRKVITSILVDSGGSAVVLDNIDAAHGQTVSQPALAALMTSSVWSDRILGLSTSVRVPNDRVWMITGNSVIVTGDMVTRSILVRLDANMPDPSRRPSSQFALGDLENWLSVPANRAHALHCLLTLARGWIVAGSPTVEIQNRSFTKWMSAMGGLTGWLGVPGFYSNSKEFEAGDEKEAEWAAFFHRWYELFGDRKIRAAELLQSAASEYGSYPTHDWQGVFITAKGKHPTAAGLGSLLRSEKRGFRGGYRLDGVLDRKGVVAWSLTKQEPECRIVPGERGGCRG